MSPWSYYIMQDFVSFGFHIFYGDLNDPARGGYQLEHSFPTYEEAFNKLLELQKTDEHDQ